MSWAEVYKINSNLTKSLNQQYEDSFRLVPMDSLLKTDTFTQTNPNYATIKYTPTAKINKAGTIRIDLYYTYRPTEAISATFTVYKNDTVIKTITDTVSYDSSVSVYAEKKMSPITIDVNANDRIYVMFEKNTSYARDPRIEYKGMVISQPTTITSIITTTT